LKSDTDPVLSLTSANGKLVLSSGQILIDLSAEDANLDQATFYYELILTNGIDVKTWLTGNWFVNYEDEDQVTTSVVNLTIEFGDVVTIA